MIAKGSRFPFSIGVDICHIPRIGAILGHKSPTDHIDPERLTRFTKKFFTPLERTLFYTHKRHLWKATRLIEHVAGKWAVKEAVIKAAPYKLSANQIFSHHFGSDSVIPQLIGYIFQKDPLSNIEYEQNLQRWTSSEPLVSAQTQSSSLHDLHNFPELRDLIEAIKHQQDIPDTLQYQVSISHETEYAIASVSVPMDHTEPETTLSTPTSTSQSRNQALKSTNTDVTPSKYTEHTIRQSGRTSFGKMAKSVKPEPVSEPHQAPPAITLGAISKAAKWATLEVPSPTEGSEAIKVRFRSRSKWNGVRYHSLLEKHLPAVENPVRKSNGPPRQVGRGGRPLELEPLQGPQVHEPVLVRKVVRRH